MGVKERYNEKYGVKGRYLQKYYGGLDLDRVDQTYIDSFVNDANTFLSTAERDYGGLTYGTAANAYNSRNATWQDLDTRAKTIEGWLVKNRSAIGADAYKSLSDSLGSYRSGGKSVLDSFKGAADFYTQFESEDAYNEWNRLQELANSENTSAGWERYLSDSNNIDDKKSNNRYLGFGDSFWGLRNYDKIKDSVYTKPNYNGDWSEDEKKIFGALYYSSPEEAYQYASDLNEGKRVSAVANRIDGTVLEPLFSALAGFDNAISGFGNIANFITGEKGADPTGLALINATMRENDKGLWKVANDLTYTTGNMLPSILVGTVTGGVGGAVTMGVSAGGNAYAEMRNLGYNEWQSRGYGALVGASEAVLSKVLGGISALGGGGDGVFQTIASKIVPKLDRALARVAIQLGGSMVDEGLEEAIQEVLDPIFKRAVTGDDFEDANLEEVLYSALLGSLSAGVLEGVPTIAQTVSANKQAKETYDTAALVSESLDIDPENTFAQKMQTKLDSGKSLSGAEINRLVHHTERILPAQDTAKMTDAVTKRLSELGETGDVSKLTAAIVKAASGETLSIFEKSIIKNSKYGNRVYAEMHPANIASGSHASSWAERLGTERINADAYNKGRFSPSTAAQDATGEAQAPSATENPAEKEKAVTAKFSASADGVTRLGDKEVSISEIASVKNGEVTFRLEDGSTVNARDLTFSSDDEVLLYENVAKMNFNAVTAQEFIKNYDPRMSALEYVLGFEEAYKAGEYGFPKSEMSTGLAARLSEAQKDIAYNLGKTDAKYKNSNTTTKEGVKNEQEGVRLRNGGEWNGSENSEESVRELENRAEQNQGRKAESRPKDRRTASLTYDREVSAKDLGIEGGSTTRKVKIVAKGRETLAMKYARADAEERGLKVTFFAGDNLDITVDNQIVSVRGYIQGNEVFIRVDHPYYTADQLMRHEIGHDMIARGEVNINDVREGIKKRFGEENVAKIADAYAEAYEGSGMNADEIWEEIICDSLGDMNVFASVELLGEMNSEFLSNLKEEVKKNEKSERGPPANEKRMSREYENADINTDVLNLVSKVRQGKYKDNDDVTLKPPTKAVLDRLSKIMGIDYSGYKVVVEARQINHILKDHGENGKTDQSMRDAQDIAKIEYTLSSPDSIEKAGKTQAYSYMLNGYNRTADTVRYEKSIGDSSYYVIQAVPVANKKTLYVVSAFIGKSGYKKGTSQLIDAKGLNATAEHGSVVIPNNIIPQKSDLSTESEKKVHDGNNIGTFSQSENDIRFSRELDVENMESANVSTPKLSNRSLLANALLSVAQSDDERKRLWEYQEEIGRIDALEEHLAEVNAEIKKLSFTKGADRSKLSALNDDKIKTQNRISLYDRRLLILEANESLKKLLSREKQKAYKKAAQEGREAISAYRNQRTKTELRNKIKKVVHELNQYLLNGTKDKHVPIELQRPVAEALDAVNMDTVDAERRIAEKRAEMMSASTPETVEKLAKEIEHLQEMGGSVAEKIAKLKAAYTAILDSPDPILVNAYDEVVSNTIGKVMEIVGTTPLRNMSLYQLEAVHDMYCMVLHTVRNANKAFKAERSAEISVIAAKVVIEINRNAHQKLYNTKTAQALSSFDWNNMKPVYAFERIGSESFSELFKNVRAGEDTWATDITEAKEFFETQRKKYGYDAWDFKKRYSFTSTSGLPFELSLDQILSLYAYAKRKQAKEHLRMGGIVIDENTEITIKSKLGFPVTFNPTQATAYNLSDDILANIVSSLTENQRGFADAMQNYLSSVMGEKGNEVSRTLYGVNLYKEKHYFPLKSATQFNAKAKEQLKGEVKIKNSGFSKETVPKASNPIVLTPFMDVWANHVNEMSMYHAFVLPLEDFYRVYNYKTATSDTSATESVEMHLQNIYGKAATQYIDQLLKDLNGGARVDSSTGVINKMTALHKKSAVFASASVVIQQPSAIARAMALLDAKYFIDKPSKIKHRETWAEVKKYAPVAIIKEMGYFDTSMGRSSVEWIKGKKTWKDKIDDAASKAPSLADELAWCAIWKAVKRETLYTHKDLRPNSEEFLRAAGERFTEIITKTQVYDSVLSRSAHMRSKDTAAKMLTAFMGEPTTSLNMLQDALIQGKRGNRRYARKAVGSVMASMILNAILVSLVYATRDDDKEKTYTEKYVSSLVEELIDGFNPLTLVPFVKDIVSIAAGYDVERSDMAIFSDIIHAWNNLDNDNRTAYRKVEDFAGALTAIIGLPVKNIMRDARGLYNAISSFFTGEKTTGAGLGNAISESVTGSKKSNAQQLYQAMLDGDTKQIDRIERRFDDSSEISSAIRKALRKNEPRIKQAAEAHRSMKYDEYERIIDAIVASGKFERDDVIAAVRAEIKAAEEDNPSANASTEDKEVSYYTSSDVNAALDKGEYDLAKRAIDDLVKTKVKNGATEKNAQASVRSSLTSYWKPKYKEAYQKKDAAEMKRIRYILYNSGLYGKASDVVNAVQSWRKD